MGMCGLRLYWKLSTHQRSRSVAAYVFKCHASFFEKHSHINAPQCCPQTIFPNKTVAFRSYQAEWWLFMQKRCCRLDYFTIIASLFFVVERIQNKESMHALPRSFLFDRMLQTLFVLHWFCPFDSPPLFLLFFKLFSWCFLFREWLLWLLLVLVKMVMLSKFKCLSPFLEQGLLHFFLCLRYFSSYFWLIHLSYLSEIFSHLFSRNLKSTI